MYFLYFAEERGSERERSDRKGQEKEDDTKKGKLEG